MNRWHMLSLAEENYLKSIHSLSLLGSGTVSTNEISEALLTKPASVSDMLKKLAQKELVNYEKYKGATLTEKGKREALKIIRKHRLWEVFLVDKLRFNWDEVHDIAEQLEHIKSPLLIERLDEFLGHPTYDPHGDPIPDSNGELSQRKKKLLYEADQDTLHRVVGVRDTSSVFLQYLDKIGVALGTELTIVDRVAFDQSLEVVIGEERPCIISREVSENIYVTG